MAITAAEMAVPEVHWFSDPAVKVFNDLYNMSQDCKYQLPIKVPTSIELPFPLRQPHYANDTNPPPHLPPNMG